MTGFKGSERDKPLFFSLPDLLIQGDLWRFIRWCRLTHANTHTANQNTTNTIFPFCSVASLEEMLKHEYAGNIFSWASTSGCEGNSRDEGTFKPSGVCVRVCVKQCGCHISVSYSGQQGWRLPSFPVDWKENTGYLALLSKCQMFLLPNSSLLSLC